MLEIKLIQLHQIQEVKLMILQICTELFKTTVEIVQQYDPMLDIDRVQANYFDGQGTFLVVMDENTVIGCGGIKYLDHEVCELKRMWLQKNYRRQGLGFKLAQMLLSFAKQAGYKVIRLDVFDPNKQKPAIAFYRKLGFYEIARYNNSPCQIFMETTLC